jgi:hypothetical protein
VFKQLRSLPVSETIPLMTINAIATAAHTGWEECEDWFTRKITARGLCGAHLGNRARFTISVPTMNGQHRSVSFFSASSNPNR